MEFFGPLLLSTIAGFATCLGIVFTYFKPKNIDRFIAISLSFAMGVMILISIKELIPIPLKNILLAYSFPFNLLITLIGPYFALKMIDLTNKNIKTNNSLFKVGILSMIILMLHNIPEGIVTFLSSLANQKLGFKLTLAIMAHNIPEGICICVPIYYATKRRGVAFFYTFIAAIAEPVGALLVYLIFRQYLNINILNILLYLIGSLMILISIKKILPEILKYHHNSWLLYGLFLSLFILLL